MNEIKRKQMLLSATGTYKILPGNRSYHFRDGTMASDLGTRNPRTLDSIRQAVTSAAKDQKTSVLSVMGSSNSSHGVMQVRPAREHGWAFLSVSPVHDFQLLPDAALIMELFSLTPTECAIAMDLLIQEDMAAICNKRGISKETARTHVKSLLRKTGASSQKKLLALLTRLAMLSPQQDSSLK
jgi:DNA-binding CsgD family transcriptional regulator